MSEAILVVLRHPDEARSLLDTAARLAETMGGARVNTLAVCETVTLAPSFATTLADRGAALLDATEEERERVVALRRLCDAWTACAVRPSTDLHWFEAEGHTADIVAQWGRRADVIVAGRPSAGDWLGQQAFKAALLGTDRPILMVPPEPASPQMRPGFGRSIAIAWRQETQTLRAVLPALRWLTNAEEMHVLVGRDIAQSPELPAVLQERGLRASLHVLSPRRGPFGQTLLDVVRDLAADLLVMGAYVQSPLRSLVFGGVTRHMLAAADLPVLMRH
jgi:nucleotide-binding universal stress UspA family protein